MRMIIAALVATFLLAGCATTAIEGSATKSRDSGAFAVATLAPWGTFEHEAAPALTRLAVARRMAARRLDDGRLSVDQARAVQAEADRARQALDEARTQADSGDRVRARLTLRGVLDRIDAVEQMIREVR